MKRSPLPRSPFTPRPPPVLLLLILALVLPFPSQGLELSGSEQAWIEAHPRVRVRIGERTPFEMMKGGRAEGMAVDYMRLVCEKLGITPEFISVTGDKGEILNRLAEGDGFDVVLLTLPTPQREERFALSKPFIRYPFALFTQVEEHFEISLKDLHGKTIALERGFATNRWLARDYPEIRILPVESTQAALEAVALGRADGYLGNLAAGAHIIQHKGYRNIKVAGLSEYGDNALALASSQAWAPFVALFEKGIASLTPNEKSRIEQRWLAVNQEFLVHWPVAIPIITVALALLALMWFANRRLQREITRGNRSEERLRAIFDQVDEAIYLIEPGQYFFVEANPALCRILGYSQQEILQIPIREIDALDDEAAITARCQRVMSKGSERFTTQWRTKAGEIRYIDNHARWLNLGDRHLVLGTAHDQTELYLARQALEEERNLFVAGPTVVFKWVLEPDWPVSYVSPNVQQLLGYSVEELIAGEPSFSSLLHVADYPHVALEVAEALADPERMVLEQHYRLRHRSGDYRWIHDTSVFIRDEQGKALSVNGYVVDRTHQEQTQLRLKQLAEVLEVTPDYVAIGTPEGHTTYLNHSARELLGLKLEEPESLGFTTSVREGVPERLHPPWALHQLREEAAPHAERHGVWVGESALRGPDGKEIPVLQSLIAHRDQQGQLQRFSTILRDIRKLKTLEQDLRRAKEQAETANRAKSAFLANMSHELRTPLNAVLGYAQILTADQRLDPELGPQLEGIYKSGNYLLLLLNDILDLARIEANRFELFPAPCEPRRFLDDLAQVFRLRAEQKGLGLVCHYTDDLSVTLMADERRLRQICMNLLGNAIKFTEQGEVGIEASYREGTLHITIVDSGIGIEAGRMDELFTPFQQQGNNPYKQLGAGLGLAISRSLAEQMGGTLTAESRPGEGSRFHFSAPLPRSDERLAQISPPAEAIWADPPRDGVAAPIATQAMVDPASSRQLLSDEPSPLDDAEVEEALAKLPAATINALENALLGGNRKQLRALLLGLEDEQPELMATLREHVDNYDYPWLLERLPA